MRVVTLNEAGMWASDAHSVVCPLAVSAVGAARVLTADSESVPTTVRGRVKTEFRG